MAVLSKTKLAQLAAELEADLGTAAARRRKKEPAAKIEFIRPPTPPAPEFPGYSLTNFVYKRYDGGCDWKAQLMLGKTHAATVSWTGSKRTSVITPLSGDSKAQVDQFAAAAARLLPGKNSVQDLVGVLIITSEMAISAFNRELMVSDIAGASLLARSPELIVA
jgi:hypothetical protein